MAALLTTQVDDAIRALRAGGLVAVPTETVYGLAADADNPGAVARIYSVKRRPPDHPVIVHLCHADAVADWARSIPGWARDLIAAWWPGPLTLVLPRSSRAGDYVTGGQDTVGLRVSAHPLLQQVLSGLGEQSAIAAPSANRFGSVSPTTAAHVVTELGEFLDATTDRILDGGPSSIGLESTIVDATGREPAILRPGHVTVDQIAQLTGMQPAAVHGSLRAPGMLANHYSPRAQVVVSEAGQASLRLAQLTESVDSVALLALQPDAIDGNFVTQFLAHDVNDYAHLLYDALRRADDMSVDLVFAVLPPNTGVGVAVRDRLQRAAAPAELGSA